MNKEKLKNEIIQAELGDLTSIDVVKEVLRPKPTDTVEQIYEKIQIFIRLFFLQSLKYQDAQFHKDIDYTYAEQIHSYLTYKKPKYKGVIIIGYRESAKTSRVKFNEMYLVCYLSELIDSTLIVSEEGGSAEQFNMDLFNSLAFSNIAKYFPNLISLEMKKKKESQTMSKFTTETGVTFNATSARKSKRGNVKIDIDSEGNIETKRPKRVIFDDIESETTIRSIQTTQHIERVMSATIDGLDQILGSFVLLGNYLSLRGNIAKFLNKYRDSDEVKKIIIPIMTNDGVPTWTAKYTRTDEEAQSLVSSNVIKRSIESIQRDSDNFETEFMCNPSRSSVYFDDSYIAHIDEPNLIDDKGRDDTGLLIIEQPEKYGVYIMSVDCASGRGGHQSAFVIWKISGVRYEEVGNFQSNKISPENLATFTANLANKYNNALIIPEVNFPGNEYIAFLCQVYTHIFVNAIKLDSNGNEQKEFGVHTNMKTKPEMFLNAKKILKNKLVDIRSRALYYQILEYPAQDIHTIEQKDGSGGHFDLLMSAVIGLFKAPTIGQDTHKIEADKAIDAKLHRMVDSVFNNITQYR